MLLRRDRLVVSGIAELYQPVHGVSPVSTRVRDGHNHACRDTGRQSHARRTHWVQSAVLGAVLERSGDKLHDRLRIMEKFETEREVMFACRRDYWRRLLEHTNGNIRGAAQIAKVCRKDAYRILKQLGFNVIRKRKPYGVMRWPHFGRMKPQTEDLTF